MLVSLRFDFGLFGKECSRPAMKKLALSLSDKVGIISLGRVFFNVAALISTMALSRLLTKPDYGTYQQVWMLEGTLVPIFLMGIPPSIYYFLPRFSESEKKGFIIQTLFLLLFIGFLVGIVFFVGADFVAGRFNNPRLSSLLRLFSLYPIFALPVFALDAALISFDLPKQVAWFQIISKGLFVLLVVMLVLLGWGLAAVFTAVIFYGLVQFIVAVKIMLAPLKGWHPRWDFTWVKQQLFYAIPLGLSGILWVIIKATDRIMVSSFFKVSEYAEFSNGAFELPIVGIITASISEILLPVFVREYRQGRIEKIVALWHESIRKAALILIPVMFFTLVFGRQIIIILFSEKYLRSVIPFRIYLLLLLPRVTAYGSLLMAIGYPKIVLTSSVFAFLLNIVLNVILIKRIGFSGPAVATVIVMYFIAFYLLMQIKGKLNLSFIKVFPWQVLGKTMAVTCLVSLLFYPATFLTLHPIVLLAIAGLIYLAVLFIVFRACKLLREDDINLLKKWSGVEKLLRLKKA